MKKALIIIGIIVAVIVVGAIYIMSMFKGPDVTQFLYLKDPEITTMDDMKVILVEAKGDPNDVGGKAFELLFKTYFRTRGTPKGKGQPAPRARWPVPPDVPRSEWIGLYAMPVPQTVTELPDQDAEAGLKLSLTTWEYGEVAQILHIGPYSEEDAAMQRLKDYIDAQGYQIIGEHEEEYLKGPGLFGKGNPEEYHTIIRYRVREAEGTQDENM